MQTKPMRLSKSILRVFEVRAKAGKGQILKEKLSNTAISVVRGQAGNLGYFFGKNLSSSEEDMVFISIWRDMESVKSRFGKDWQQSYLPEGYEEIIESCSIKHIEFEGSLMANG